jgi:hypothetical protein
MDDVVRQAITTKLTMSEMAGISFPQLSWQSFYQFVLSLVKMLDKSKKDRANPYPQNYQSKHNRSHGNGHPLTIMVWNSNSDLHGAIRMKVDGVIMMTVDSLTQHSGQH